ncbi:Fpg/Nei family DNA glycosylase [Nocardioides sp. SYSU D00038]|uniref:Fpg/Nei family DNA glycosylase n=1 Tax=Nocardioides sp. SYSU D00038 TaxID=2812554 RepID=UPI001967DF42|nr:DNA-formamidopyrimidine glycosylase family protein [Nocardioides sp. SYSU D00038]
MPEGHTVHRLARDLAELSGGPVAARSPQGRFAEGAAAVDGAVLRGADAVGKHLLLDLLPAGVVHVHLGMRGIFLRGDDPGRDPMPQTRLRLASDRVAWDLVAPSTCELLDEAGVAILTDRLGPDPLRLDADVGRVLSSWAADGRPIGTVLLDQAVVAGVGNVFRAEALHAVGIHPTRPARNLDEEQRHRLWEVLRTMMATAVEDGRIVTVDGPDRLSVPEAEARRVYKQEHCRDCGAPVVVSQVGGRTAYHCPVEQPDDGGA